MSGGGSAAVVLRAMVADDVAQVAAIEAVSLPTPWSAEAFRHELDIPFSKAFVAHPSSSRDVVVGYVVLWHVADEIHLLDLAVAEGWRRAGVGRLLASRVLDEARALAVRLVTLEVGERNEAARRLYAGAGFVTAFVRHDYYGEGRHALVMERRIGTA